MAIPEANLDTWSSIGAIQTSAMTYASVRSALLAAGTGYEGKVDVYLQGSYANHTNIRKESDVDVVVQLTSAFHYDLDALPPDQKDAFRTTYPTNANYAGAQYKADVLAALRDAFGGDAQPGSKAISIAGNPNRRKADVIVATSFKNYSTFLPGTHGEFVDSICFFKSDGSRIVNFPKKHSENATIKHQATGNRYKPMVRIFKNIRERLYADNKLAAGTAPSYFIEGLLYNVTNDRFSGSLQDAFLACFDHLVHADRTQLACVNMQHWLIRENQPTSWNDADCVAFLNAVSQLWNEWA